MNEKSKQLMELLERHDELRAKMEETWNQLKKAVAIHIMCPDAWDGDGPTTIQWITTGSGLMLEVKKANGDVERFPRDEVPEVLHDDKGPQCPKVNMRTTKRCGGRGMSLGKDRENNERYQCDKCHERWTTPV